MPTYQYRCKNCGEEFEKVQSFSDDSTPKCPSCGTRSKKNIAKVFGAVGISFKGDGFYKNDHGKKGSKTAAKTSTSSGDSGGSSESAGTTTGASSSSSSSESSSD